MTGLVCERCGREIEDENYYVVSAYDVLGEEQAFYARFCPSCYEVVLRMLWRLMKHEGEVS